MSCVGGDSFSGRMRNSSGVEDRFWVKNGPDALEMGCLYYPRKQTSVSHAADCDVIIC
jgi:hypothetical protein